MPNAQTRETLAADIWRACDILCRDNNCGGVMVNPGKPPRHKDTKDRKTLSASCLCVLVV